MFHEVLLHAERHLAHGALVRLAGRMDRPLVLVHRVGVRELAIALRTLDHDALVEDPDVFGQLGPDGVRFLALVAVVSLLHAVHPNFVSVKKYMVLMILLSKLDRIKPYYKFELQMKGGWGTYAP